MNIFLLEDDRETATYLLNGLTELGHQVDHCEDGVSAIGAILGKEHDVIVLDRMVPHCDGLSVLKAIRASGCKTPALLLTARSRIEDRVDGFDAGADDYLVKPYAFVELVARLNALARRPPPVDMVTVLRAGEVEMDLLRRTVTRAGRDIELQPREFALLEHLLRNSGKVVTRTMLLDRVWNLGFDPRTNIVETHVSRLRAKLDEGFATSAIRTVRGAGYMIVDLDA
jgi:two-component system OmpR family response regulator